MKVELGFIRRALEAKGRADNPFDRENQLYDGPLFPMPAPPILRAGLTGPTVARAER
jgi:hypothetical protein